MWGAFVGPNPAGMVSAPLPVYPRPPDLGGATANPGVQTDYTVRNGAAYELRYGFASSNLDDWTDNRSYMNSWTFDGNAWTIQLTIRPGMYVPPEQLVQMGWSEWGSAPYA